MAHATGAIAVEQVLTRAEALPRQREHGTDASVVLLADQDVEFVGSALTA